MIRSFLTVSTGTLASRLLGFARDSLIAALLGAANRGANDIIRLLAANGARVDVVDKEGRSALRWAEGVFLAAVGAERKPATIALLEEIGAPHVPPR